MIEVKWNKYLGEFQSKKDAYNGDRLYLKKDNNSAAGLKSLSKLSFHDLAS